MFPVQNKQIDTIFTVESLDLNFSKKKERKMSSQVFSSTERKYSIAKAIPEPLKTQRSVLMEKKKNYSDAIRQRNLNLLAKKRNEPINYMTLNENASQKALFEIKQNLNTQPQGKEKTNSTMLKRNERSNYKRLGSKKSLASMSVLDFEPIPFFQETGPAENQEIMFSPRLTQAKESFNSPEKCPVRLKLCSQEVNEQVLVLDSDTTILVKQNTTFKRDLASFKKENSILRKDLQEAKSHIEELQEKAKLLLESSLLHSVKLSLDPEESSSDSSNREEIIQKLRAEVAELKNVNSGLELRAYMAEKKVVEEVAACKKKMAKELHEWRDKCTRLRAENMKFKSFRDVTLSMEISKDQQ